MYAVQSQEEQRKLPGLTRALPGRGGFSPSGLLPMLAPAGFVLIVFLAHLLAQAQSSGGVDTHVLDGHPAEIALRAASGVRTAEPAGPSLEVDAIAGVIEAYADPPGRDVRRVDRSPPGVDGEAAAADPGRLPGDAPDSD